MKHKVKWIVMALFMMAAIPMNGIRINASVGPNKSFSGSANCGIYEGPVTVTTSNATLTGAGNFCERGRSVSATAIAGSKGTASLTFVITDAVDTSKVPPVEVGSVTIGTTSVSIASASKPSNPGSSSSGSSNSSSSGNTSGNSSSSSSTKNPEQEPKDDPRSKDNTLKQLSINKGTLSPKFAADVTSYKASLPADTKELVVTATPKDTKAKVSGTGKIKVEPGENIITVVCTSEYGTKKEYVLHLDVDEKPLLYTTYQNAQLGVVRNLRNVKVPTGFKETKVKLGSDEVTAWKNTKMNKTILYLADEKNNKNFYLYENEKVTSKLVYTQLLGQSFYLIDVPTELQKVEGMKYETIKIDKTDLMGWTFTDAAFKNYAVFYVMDMDGTTRYYQYEKEQNTLQRYAQTAPVTQKAYTELIQQKEDLETAKLGWMVFGIVAAIIAAVIGGFALMREKAKKNITQ